MVSNKYFRYEIVGRAYIHVFVSCLPGNINCYQCRKGKSDDKTINITV